MRLPRIRFTVGRLLGVVVILGVVLWGVLIVRPRYLHQMMVERQAEAIYKQAKLVREVAQFAVKEYTEVIYGQDLATYQGQIALAQVDLNRATDRLKWLDGMGSYGPIPAGSRNAYQLAVEQARFDLDQATTQLAVLNGYTKQKQIKSLKNDLAKASADEQAKVAAYGVIRDRRLLLMLGF